METKRLNRLRSTPQTIARNTRPTTTMPDPSADPDLEPDVVLGTLENFCSHVPEWIDDSVYLSPSGILYLAVLAVVVAVVGERLHPSLGLTFHALKLAVLNRGQEQLGKSGAEQLAVQGMAVALSKLRRLPVPLRKVVEDKARVKFPGMPEVSRE